MSGEAVADDILIRQSRAGDFLVIGNNQAPRLFAQSEWELALGDARQRAHTAHAIWYEEERTGIRRSIT
jgi:hypothetical protein